MGFGNPFFLIPDLNNAHFDSIILGRILEKRKRRGLGLESGAKGCRDASERVCEPISDGVLYKFGCVHHLEEKRRERASQAFFWVLVFAEILVVLGCVIYWGFIV